MPCAKRQWEIWRPRKNTLVIDILGNLKLAFMEMTKGPRQQLQCRKKVKSRP